VPGYNHALKRGVVAQLVRAPDCRSGGCGFEPRRPRFFWGPQFAGALVKPIWILREIRRVSALIDLIHTLSWLAFFVMAGVPARLSIFSKARHAAQHEGKIRRFDTSLSSTKAFYNLLELRLRGTNVSTVSIRKRPLRLGSAKAKSLDQILVFIALNLDRPQLI
jgi:hypothetical protein